MTVFICSVTHNIERYTPMNSSPVLLLLGFLWSPDEQMERSQFFFRTLFRPNFRVGDLHKIHPSFVSHTIRLSQDPHLDPSPVCTFGPHLSFTLSLATFEPPILYHISRSHIWASQLVVGYIWVTQQLHRHQSHIWALLTFQGPHLSLAASATSEPNSFDILTKPHSSFAFSYPGSHLNPTSPATFEPKVTRTTTNVNGPNRLPYISVT